MEWFTSIVTFVLSLFGIDYGKSKVVEESVHVSENVVAQENAPVAAESSILQGGDLSGAPNDNAQLP